MSSDENDKTVQRPAGESNHTDKPGSDASQVRPDAPDDQTRIARPRQSGKKVNDALEQKRRQAAAARAASPAGDATVVKPRRPLEEADDRTRISPRPGKAEKPAAANPDKTQFKGPRRPVARENADKTRINIPAGGRSLEPGGSPAPKSATPKAGEHVLKNRFVFEQMLGAGGMGMVYKAKDLLKIEAQDRDPYVAIKVLGEEFKSHPEAFIALQRESRKTQRIAHPNIVNVFDFDKDGDTVFMTMEFLDGKPLDKLISQYKATGLPAEDAWKILEGICAALIYAHGEKIIHSDFKPGNIFVTNKGLAKVFDFGIARAVAAAEAHEDDPEDKTVFDAGNLGALTPAYASKEMLEGLEPDIRDDIYALGCIAYEMFTGRHPFDRVHANEAARLNMKPERIPELTKIQWRALESALAFDRENRVASVDEFWEQMTRKQQSFLVAGIVTVVILVLLSSVGYLFFMNQNQDPGISEDEVRNEIEMQLRVEQHRNNITNLLASLEFSRTWETELWNEMRALAKLVGEEDAWWLEHKAASYTAYQERIERLITEESVDGAEILLANASRYQGDDGVALAALQQKLDELKNRIAERQAEEERKAKLAQQAHSEKVEQQRIEKQKRDIFDQAMTNVNEQLSCRTGLNMRDLKIAVDKLREVDPARYRKSEPKVVQNLSDCIAKVGRSFPERAAEYKKQAMRLFPNNNVIASTAIVPKDPCDTSLAGLGARGKRAICRDRLAGEDRGPALVVIPGKGSIKPFAIGKYEVSVGEYNAYCAESKACTAIANSDADLPVTGISLQNARSYLAWLGDKAKRKYRLPSRSEWEYAARAESGRLDSNRNCKLNSRGIQKGGSLIKVDVGAQNRWGLVNHVGNAREWVADRGGNIVAVGGSYETAMEDCVVTLSEPQSGSADAFTGFRVLREIIER